MKRLLKKLAVCGLAATAALSFAACGALDNDQAGGTIDDGLEWNGSTAPGGNSGMGSPDYVSGDAVNDDCPAESGGDNYVYNGIVEQDFTNVANAASSYFSLDRNTASYSQIRSQIENGWTISPYSVRIEELINYFDYDFEAPADSAVGVSAYLSDCPWNDNHKLMLAGIKTVEKKCNSVNGNYVFLIDVSGSMSGDSRLGLAKYGLNKLVDNLGEGDKVSIVTYASGVNTVLDSGECSAEGKANVIAKINGLKAAGATYASGGLEKAYELAQKNFISDGNNRVIIISDGDFNVGISNTNTMMEYISGKAQSGIYLSVLGVGMGNMRDDMLETLARNGNGNYAYLDNKTEAEKVLCHELNGMLMTVAKDAKAGVTFEQDAVVKYRLIGYDTKIISEDEYNDPTTDAGELGSNLCVTALYEIELAEHAEGKLANIEVKFKDVTGEDAVDSAVSVEVTTSTLSSHDLSFISCVAEFGLILRQSKYAQNANIYSVLERLSGLSNYISADAYKQEFVTLVGKASEMDSYKKTGENL